MKQFIKYIKAFLELIVSFVISKNWVWRLINRSAILSFENFGPKLTKFEKKIVDDIENFGFSVLDLSYFGNNILSGLISYKKQLKPSESNVKSFLIYYLGGMFNNTHQIFNKTNPLLELSTSKKLTNIVNSYFKMHSRLTYLEINKTLVKKNKTAQMSQKFRKDPGIKKCIKVFIYLNNVNLDNGPFTYVKFSHKLERYGLKQKRFGAGGIYPKEIDFNKSVKKRDIFPIVGKAGTVIIADTTGLHCGGNSIKSSREMATIVFYPPGDLKKSKININIPNFDKEFPSIKYLIPKHQRRV